MINLQQAEPKSWVCRLQSEEPERELAIQQLRDYLVRGLDRSLSHRYGGKVQAEDIAQVALLKILHSLDSFQQRSRFETWAMSIAIRVGISELRKRHYRDVSIDLSSSSDSFQIELADPTADDIEARNHRQHLLTLLQRLIDETLSDKQRSAIRGTLAGLPVEEIASRLNSNRNAIYKLLHDARVRLRLGFETHGVTAEDLSTLIA